MKLAAATAAAAAATLLHAPGARAAEFTVRLERSGRDSDYILCELDLYVREQFGQGGFPTKIELRDASGSNSYNDAGPEKAIDGDYIQDMITWSPFRTRRCFRTEGSNSSPFWEAKFDWPSNTFEPPAFRVRAYPRNDERDDDFLDTTIFVAGQVVGVVTQRADPATGDVHSFQVERPPPTDPPTMSPSLRPTATPSETPSVMPSAMPSATPSATPTGSPLPALTAVPSSSPSAAPTASPSGIATPTASPVAPTSSPSSSSSAEPSAEPTTSPVAFVGGCENAGDKDLWNSRDVMADMDDIDPVCTGTPDYRTCSTRWFFESARYSLGCAECLGEMAGCLETRCSCPEGQEMQGSCLSCFEAKCVAPFEACAGLLMRDNAATEAPTTSGSGGPSSPDDGTSEGVGLPTTIVAIGGGVGGALLLAAIGAVMFVRGRRKRVDVDALIGVPKSKLASGDQSRETINPAFGSVAVPIPPASRMSRDAPRTPPSRPPTLPRPAEVRANSPAVVLFDCEGQAEDELSCAEGTVLLAVERVNNEWWWCENPATEELGLVPANVLGGKP